MDKEKIITWMGTLSALAAAILLFFYWHPEDILRRGQAPITLKEIQQNPFTDYTGDSAGKDIPRLSGAEEFSHIIYDYDYITAEPVGIVSTGVYSLKEWVSPYRSQKRKGTEKRKQEVLRSSFPLQEDYHPYYLLKLKDGSYILAQIPVTETRAIQRGETVLLPVGQKVRIENAARNYLKPIGEAYQVDIEEVFYAWDREWYEKYYYVLFLFRFGVSAVVFFIKCVVKPLASAMGI